jgi:hypothetical protein
MFADVILVGFHPPMLKQCFDFRCFSSSSDDSDSDSSSSSEKDDRKSKRRRKQKKSGGVKKRATSPEGSFSIQWNTANLDTYG